MKKALSILLCLVLAIGCLSVTALTASADTQPRYTVLLLDVSGSMYSDNRIEDEKSAAIRFCETATSPESKNKVAIVTFSDEITTVCDFTNDLETLKTAINGIMPSGLTNFTDALRRADELLVAEEAKGVDFERNIVLCSDGLPENGETSYEGPYTHEDCPYDWIYPCANAALAYDNTLKPTTNIYTIGFFQGFEVELETFAQRFMSDLANKMSVVTDEADKLIETFQDFAEEIVKEEIPDESAKEEIPDEPAVETPTEATSSTTSSKTNSTASTSVQNPSNAASIAQAIQTGDPVAFFGIMALAFVAFGAIAFTSKRRESEKK